MADMNENPNAEAVAEAPTLSRRERAALAQAQLDDIAEQEATEKADAEAASRSESLAAVAAYEATEAEKVREEMTALRDDFARLVPVWNALAASDAGGRLLHQLAGYSFDPQKSPAHVLAGTSLQGRVRAIGEADERVIAQLVDAEEQKRLAAVAETVANTRAEVGA